MREEYVSLSPAGAFAVALVGFFVGQSLDGTQVAANLAIAFLCLLVVRTDAMEMPRSGRYRRRWFVWRREGSAE